VPVWHAALRDLEKAGTVAVVAIAQDQHADRARLFMQWKQIEWPLLADSLDLLNLETVPLTVAVDEYGVVRLTELPMSASNTIEQIFVNQVYPKPGTPIPVDRGVFETFRTRTAAIDAYRRDVDRHPHDGAAQFRLGSAYRARYDSAERHASDFEDAERHWATALEIDPNRYIWRRRAQQYGPRTAEPYAFFDWMRDARRDIIARGDTPTSQSVEPGDSEFATPDPRMTAARRPTTEPDPRGRIRRDRGEFVGIDATTVPAAPQPGDTVRIHLTLRPNPSTKAHWNNTADPLVYWMNPPAGVAATERAVVVPNAETEVSQETRTVEYDVKLPAPDAAGRVERLAIPGYALYYVCEDVNGVCMYRRHDVTVTIPVGSSTR
jgi:hypothetical protein